MTSVLYKVTNKFTGKSLIATFPGTVAAMKTAVTAAAQAFGQSLLVFEILSYSINPARSERNFRAQSYLNGVVFLESPDFADLFVGTPAPVPPPANTIPDGTIFTAGDGTLTFTQALKCDGEVDFLGGTLLSVGQ